MTDRKPHLAILGAGPTGLDAALAAADAGIPFTVYEAAPEPGGHVRAWGHVRLFTPWDMNVSSRMRRHLEAAGVPVPTGGDCPTGRELAERVLAPVAALPEVAPHLRLGTRAVALGREGLLKHEEIATAARGARPFRLLVSDRDGEHVEHADVVIDATGTYGQPNSLGDGGIPAPGERELATRIRRDLPDLGREAADWAGKTVLVAGAGHSAETAVAALADLARQAPGTRVVWALRRGSPAATPGAGAADPLPERARLESQAAELAAGGSPAVEVRRGVVVEALEPSDGRIGVVLRNGGNGAGRERVVVDRVLALTGYVGDHDLYRQLQVHECYATTGPIQLSAALLGAGAGDCLAQTSHGAEVLKSPEPNFYILGIKSYGRNNTFLMQVGWRQVDEVFGLLGA